MNMGSHQWRLVVIPSDPIAAYEQAGYDWLERYYNPMGMFHEVYAVSPLEKGERKAYGMTILGVSEREFPHVLRDIRPDVVRAYGGFWPADLACRYRIRDIPIVVSVHDTNPALLHKSVCYADLVICVSTAVEKLVLAKGVDPKRIRRLPNRVDTKVFCPLKGDERLQSVAGRFPPGKHILHVGRKSHQKNLDTLIQALQFLPTDYSCIFVGRGDVAPYVSLAEQVGVADRCFWIESVKNSELPLWYSWCDCFCVPSRWEGFGIVFIEAAACGVPIVTSDIAPMNEYLSHDASACLVGEYENPRALAEAIRKVCEDVKYRETLSTGAVKAAQPFDRAVVDEMEVAIYREALALRSLSLGRWAGWSIWRGREMLTSSGMVTLGRRIVHRAWREAIGLQASATQWLRRH